MPESNSTRAKRHNEAQRLYTDIGVQEKAIKSLLDNISYSGLARPRMAPAARTLENVQTLLQDAVTLLQKVAALDGGRGDAP